MDPETPTDAISVSVKTAASKLGLSIWQVKQRCNAGLIESRFDGPQRLVDVKSLEAYFKSLPTERPDVSA